MYAQFNLIVFVSTRLTCDENTAVLVKAMKLVYSYRDILFYDNDEAFDILVKLVYKNRYELSAHYILLTLLAKLN